MVNELRWIQEGDTELAYVYGQLQVTPGAPALLAEMPAALTPGHQAVYVGEVKLPEIRSAMQRANMQAELAQVRALRELRLPLSHLTAHNRASCSSTGYCRSAEARRRQTAATHCKLRAYCQRTTLRPETRCIRTIKSCKV